jgi:hypothetical protein
MRGPVHPTDAARCAAFLRGSRIVDVDVDCGGDRPDRRDPVDGDAARRGADQTHEDPR